MNNEIGIEEKKKIFRRELSNETHKHYNRYIHARHVDMYRLLLDVANYLQPKVKRDIHFIVFKLGRESTPQGVDLYFEHIDIYDEDKNPISLNEAQLEEILEDLDSLPKWFLEAIDYDNHVRYDIETVKSYLMTVDAPKIARVSHTDEVKDECLLWLGKRGFTEILGETFGYLYVSTHDLELSEEDLGFIEEKMDENYKKQQEEEVPYKTGEFIHLNDERMVWIEW